MAVIYPYLVVVHLCCAIIFVGFLFTDVVILGYVFKRLDEEKAREVKNLLGNIETKIMPPCLLLLILSGGAMLSHYIGGDKGYFESPFQTLLIIKALFALSIFGLAAFSLSMYYIFKRPNPLGKYTHPIIFGIAVIVVLLAKFMFIV